MIERRLCTHWLGEFKLTNTIISNHNNSIHIVNLYTVSIDNPVIMPFIPWIYAEGFKQWCNHEICATTLFFITKCWGRQKILCSPLSKGWGDMLVRPSLYSVPDSTEYNLYDEPHMFVTPHISGEKTMYCVVAHCAAFYLLLNVDVWKRKREKWWQKYTQPDFILQPSRRLWIKN